MSAEKHAFKQLRSIFNSKSKRARCPKGYRSTIGEDGKKYCRDINSIKHSRTTRKRRRLLKNVENREGRALKQIHNIFKSAKRARCPNGYRSTIGEDGKRGCTVNNKAMRVRRMRELPGVV